MQIYGKEHRKQWLGTCGTHQSVVGGVVPGQLRTLPVRLREPVAGSNEFFVPVMCPQKCDDSREGGVTNVKESLHS
jgi:hypothetical protein